jgi:hypothetical protein
MRKPRPAYLEESVAEETMAYFMLVMGKVGLCRGSSSYRNSDGWHDVTGIGRPLSGSGYRYQGRDELNRRVEVKMVWESRAHQIAGLLDHDGIQWVAIEEVYDGKARSWWTFFDVSGGWGEGTDDSSPNKSSLWYDFEFRSARYGTGVWPGAIRTQIPKTGVDPSRVVDSETNQAILALPVPASLKRY